MVYADASIRQQSPSTKPSPGDFPGNFPEVEVSSGVELGGVEASGVAAGVVEAGGGGGGGGGAALGECAVVLGDRDVQETLRRLGGALTALTDRSGKDKGDGGAGLRRGGKGEGVGGQRKASGAGVGSVAGGLGLVGTGGAGELDVEVRGFTQESCRSFGGWVDGWVNVCFFLVNFSLIGILNIRYTFSFSIPSAVLANVRRFVP